MMTENHYENRNENEWHDSSHSEKLDRELKRLWESEIRAYFAAERDFLLKYGRQTGYDDSYIFKVFADHRILEELVQEGGEENTKLFSQRLAGHFRFKEEYAAKHLEKMTDPPKGASLDGPLDGRDN